MVCTAVWAKSIAVLIEFCFTYRLQHLFDTLLEDSVLYCGYSQGAQTPIRFWYLYSAYRMRMKILQSFPNIGNQFIRGLFSHLNNGGVICTLCLAPFVLLDRAVCQHDIVFAGYDVHQLCEAFSM